MGGSNWVVWVCLIVSNLAFVFWSFLLFLKRHNFPLNQRWSCTILLDNFLLWLWIISYGLPYLLNGQGGSCLAPIWQHGVLLGAVVNIYVLRAVLVLFYFEEARDLQAGADKLSWCSRHQYLISTPWLIVFACMAMLISCSVPIYATASQTCTALGENISLASMTYAVLFLWPIPLLYGVSYWIRDPDGGKCLWLKQEIAIVATVFFAVAFITRIQNTQVQVLTMQIAAVAMLSATTIYPLYMEQNVQLSPTKLQSISLEQILKHKKVRDMFAHYLESEFTDELLLYYEAVEALRPCLAEYQSTPSLGDLNIPMKTTTVPPPSTMGHLGYVTVQHNGSASRHNLQASPGYAKETSVEVALRDLYLRFLSPSAITPVNMDQGLLKTCQDMLRGLAEEDGVGVESAIESSWALSSQLAECLFKTKLEVARHLEQGPLPRFLNSPSAAKALVCLFNGPQNTPRRLTAHSLFSPSVTTSPVSTVISGFTFTTDSRCASLVNTPRCLLNQINIPTLSSDRIPGRSLRDFLSQRPNILPNTLEAKGSPPSVSWKEARSLAGNHALPAFACQRDSTEALPALAFQRDSTAEIDPSHGFPQESTARPSRSVADFPKRAMDTRAMASCIGQDTRAMDPRISTDSLKQTTPLKQPLPLCLSTKIKRRMAEITQSVPLRDRRLAQPTMSEPAYQLPSFSSSAKNLHHSSNYDFKDYDSKESIVENDHNNTPQGSEVEHELVQSDITEFKLRLRPSHGIGASIVYHMSPSSKTRGLVESARDHVTRERGPPTLRDRPSTPQTRDRPSTPSTPHPRDCPSSPRGPPTPASTVPTSTARVSPFNTPLTRSPKFVTKGLRRNSRESFSRGNGSTRLSEMQEAPWLNTLTLNTDTLPDLKMEVDCVSEDSISEERQDFPKGGHCKSQSSDNLAHLRKDLVDARSTTPTRHVAAGGDPAPKTTPLHTIDLDRPKRAGNPRSILDSHFAEVSAHLPRVSRSCPVTPTHGPTKSQEQKSKVLSLERAPTSDSPPAISSPKQATREISLESDVLQSQMTSFRNSGGFYNNVHIHASPAMSVRGLMDLPLRHIHQSPDMSNRTL
eukprot:g8950.t1